MQIEINFKWMHTTFKFANYSAIALGWSDSWYHSYSKQICIDLSFLMEVLVILVILVYTKIDKLLEYSKLKVLDNVGVLVLNLIINGDLVI